MTEPVQKNDPFIIEGLAEIKGRDSLADGDTVEVYLRSMIGNFLDRVAKGAKSTFFARKQAKIAASDFLGRNPEWHTSRFNSPGMIDEFCREYVSITDTNPDIAMQAVFLRMFDEVLDVAVLAGTPGTLAEETHPALDEIVHRYAQYLLGYPPQLDETAMD